MTLNNACSRIKVVTIVTTVIALLTISAIPFPAFSQGSPEYTEAFTGLPADGDYSHVKLADLNKDGKTDIISGADSYGDVDTHGLYVWTGNGAGVWTESSSGLPTTENFGGIGVGDLNKDGNPDIVAGYETWSGSDGLGVGVWLGNGGSGGLSFSAGTKPIESGGYDSAEVADVDDDGNLDILGASRGNGIKIWLGNGAMQWTEASDGLPTGGEYTGITAGDVDDDGDLDIAAGNYGGHGIQVWIRNSDGTWTENSNGLHSSDNSFSVVFEDFNEDGNLDLAGTVRGRGVFVWTGNGGSGGEMQWTEDREGLPTSGRYKQISVADFDNDDNLDIVAAMPDGGLHVWRGNGGEGGSMMFTEASGNLPTSEKYYGASFGKVNGDGILDIVGAGWNVGVKAWTTALGPADETPPSAITDLAASAVDHQRVRLTWTATGDDGSQGTATSYDIRYSSSDISDMNDFDAAFKADNEPKPKAAGSSESFTVTGLSANRTYYFAVVVNDEGPNPSPLSNVVSAKTPEAPSAPNPPTVSIKDPLGGSTIKGTVTITFEFSDQDNDVNEMEIFMDGIKVDSRTGMTSPQTWNWDTKSSEFKVSNGEHKIRVVVIDLGGHSASDEVTYIVKNKKDGGGGTPGFEAILLIAVLIFLVARKR
jgi:hypothetical protein